MRRVVLGTAALLCCAAWLFAIDAKDQPSSQTISPAPNTTEARARARIIHELVRGTLQIMHRDFFDDDNAHSFPSASLEDVFHEMGENYDVKLKRLTGLGW